MISSIFLTLKWQFSTTLMLNRKTDADQDMKSIHELSMELEAKDRLIYELLKAHQQEKGQVEGQNEWDHSAQKDPLVVKMNWEQMLNNIENLFPQVMADMKNDDKLNDMLKFDPNQVDSGVTTDVIFRYFHLLEKSAGCIDQATKVKAIRPLSLVTKPIKSRKKICHRLELNHFDEVLPKETIDSFDVILGLVIMDIDGKCIGSGSIFSIRS